MNIIPSLIAMLPGAAIATVGAHRLYTGRSEALEEMKKDMVSPRAIVKKYAPDVYVATSREDLKDFKIDPEVEKKLARTFRGLNAIYGSADGKATIVSPKMINKSLLGHEIGHHLAGTSKEKQLFKKILQTPEERKAWEASPFQDEQSKRVAEKMLKTYEGSDIMTMGGIASMIGAMAAPIILKALKK